ncbi:MAG TPA: glycosyltransferase family 87 protein [Solirubrobacteraceae bacterium]
MLQDSNQPERPITLASGPIAGAGATAGGGEGAVALPRIDTSRLRAALPWLRVRFGRRAGRSALAALILATFAVVACAAAGPSILVPRSAQTFPNWEAGPLHDFVTRIIEDPQTLGLAFSGVLAAMVLAYGIVLASVRTLSMKSIAICVVILHAILLLSPPLQLTDLFNYLGYARLGALHHLNPYTHVIKQEFYDPVYRFTSWHNLKSPYGPLFTALSYPLAFTSLPVAYWTVKVVTVLLSLGFVAIVWQCARQLGHDPRFAVVFVALNPIFLLYAVAGFHNDFFMLAASMGAISLLLARRDRAAGALLMIAIAVKFTAVVLLPFLLLGARTRARAIKLLVGAAVTAVPLIAISVSLFGLSIPNLSDQSSLLTDFSIPNLFGLAIGIGGGAPALLRLANVAVVLVVAYEVYRRRDWLIGAGWSTFALIASLAWLVPWYVVWLLPLAALATSVRLRRTALVLTLFLVFAFVPATSIYFAKHGINLLSSSVGQASKSHQHKLAF